MHTLNKVIDWNPYYMERSCELVLSTMQNGVFARLLMRYRHLSLKSITCDVNVCQCWEPRCAHVRRSTFSWNFLLPSGFNLPPVHTQLPRDFELDAVHWIHFPLMALGIGILYSAIIPCFLNVHQYISAQDATQSSSTPNLDLLPAKDLERMSWYNEVLKAWVENCYWHLVDSIWILAVHMGRVFSPDIAPITALGLDSLEFSKVIIGFWGEPSWRVPTGFLRRSMTGLTPQSGLILSFLWSLLSH